MLTTNNKPYLGEHGVDLLITGFARGSKETIPPELFNIISNYVNFDKIEDFTIPYYSPTMTKIFIPEKIDEYLTEICINSIATRHANIIALGSIPTQPEEYINYEFQIKNYLPCNLVAPYEIGCVSMPKKHPKHMLIKEMERLVHPEIDGIVNESNLQLSSPWYFKKDKTNAFTHFGSISPQTQATACHLSKLKNLIDISFSNNEKGDITWSFKDLSNYKVIYKEWVKQYHSCIVVILPACLCTCKHNVQCEVRTHRVPPLVP